MTRVGDVTANEPGFEPYTEDLGFLETLADVARDRSAVESTALRSRSLAMRSLLAFRATGGALLYQDLVRQLHTDPRDLPELDLEWTIGLARVAAFQTGSPEDLRLARDLMRRIPEGRLKARHTSFYAKLCYELGEYAECRRLLRRRYRNGIAGKAHLLADLANPRTTSPYGSDRRWTRAFGQLFTEHGLEPPRLAHGSASALDRLDLEPNETVDGPLMTVILTSFRPDARLFTAVRSILRQTYQNFELLIVDDASGPEYMDVLDEAVAMDSRIRLIRQEVNGGTYLARNAGIAEARGELMTGQDDDDWSHPRRIEWQYREFVERPETTAVRGWTLMTDEDLVLNRLGHPVFSVLSSSYMTRVETARRVGGYLEARKGADTEFTRRVEAITGQPLVDLRLPLGVYRMSKGSLSRGEFGPGWHHPVRAAFWSTAKLAHERAARGTLDEESVRQSIAIPHRYQVERKPLPRYDLLIAADWRESRAARHPLLGEVEALIGTGQRVALLHMPDHRRPQRRRFEIHPSIQAMINDRVVDRLLLDDDAPVGTVLVLQPGVLQLPSEGPVKLRADRAVVVANQVPAAGRKVAYVTRECARTVRRFFGVDPLWVARSTMIHESLAAQVPAGQLSELLLPPAVHLDAWELPPRPPRSRRPIIGHHARGAWDWPEDLADLVATYPTDGSFDVRILGTAGSALARLGFRRTPPAWMVYPEHDTDPRRFLHQLDFYVHLPSPLGGEDSILSAAFASGRVVVLPPATRAQYGDAAVYAEPGEVSTLIRALHAQPARYLAVADGARAYARRELTVDVYLQRMAAIGTGIGRD